MTEGEKVFEEWLLRYGPNSRAGESAAELFVREVWGVEPDEGQIPILRAFSRGDRRIAALSCHGTGKTTVADWLSWIMLCTRYPQKTAVTAPTKGQLEDAYFADLASWHKRLPEVIQPLFELKKNRIELRASPGDSFLTAKTARDEKPEALQGVHSANVLLIADEASGVSEAVFEAAAGSMSTDNATTLLLSNGTRTSGLFFDAWHSLSHMWTLVCITSIAGTLDPLGRPAYLSTRTKPDFIEQIALQYGKGSNAWRVRVLGLFPTSDQDSIIPFEYIESARGRDIVVPPSAGIVWGLDVARFGDDDNVIVRRQGSAILPLIQAWEGVDLMSTTGRLKSEYDEALPQEKPGLIMIDEIGLGAGVVDRARELGLPVRGINVSERQGVDELYHNVRTELWFKGREWLAGLNRQLPTRCTCGKCDAKTDHAEQLARELGGLKYDVADSSGKWLAEPKKAYKKRTKQSSPNVADAMLLTLAGDAAVLLHGGKASKSNLNKPLRRRRSIV